MPASRKTKSTPKASGAAGKKSAKPASAPKAKSSKSPAKLRAKPAAVKKVSKMEKTTKSPATRKQADHAKAAAPAKSKPAEHAKPAKMPSVDPELLKTIREALVSQRNQLLMVVQSTQAQLAEKETGLADVSDRASGGFEDELAMGLMQIEAAQIDDIEAAIRRIDEGTYGVCVDCQKLIPRKRLEVLPFAQRCLECEGTKERRARMQIGGDEDSDGRDND